MMHDFSGLISKAEEKASQVEKLEAIFMDLTASRVLSYNNTKKVSGNLVVLVDKVKQFNDMQIAARDKKGAELEDAGFDILKEVLEFLFKEENTVMVEIIADLLDISREDAGNMPLSIIYECIIKDKVVRTFFPRLALSEARTQSDISPNVTAFPRSPPTPFSSEQKTSMNLTGSNLNLKS